MTEEIADIDNRSHSFAGLLTDFFWWSLLLLGGILCLWALGFEAIIYHPTPFYGLWLPVGSMGFLLGCGALVSSIAFVALLLTPGVRRGPRLNVLLLGVGLGIAAVIAGVSIDEGLQPFMHHALVATLASSCIALYCGVLQRLFAEDEEPSIKYAQYFVLGIMVFAFAFPGTIAMLRGGVEAIASPYFRYDHEYIGDLGIGGSIVGLFRQYVDVHAHLSMHSKVHPPGPIVLLWMMSYIVGREPLALALATMAVGALSVWPMYALSALMFESRRLGIIAAAIYALVPTIVLFTATSTDIVFMPFTLGALYCFWKAMHGPSFRFALVAGVFYAIMSLTSFSLIAVGGFFGMVGLWRLTQRECRKAVFTTAAGMLLSFIGIHLAIRFSTGFDIIEVFHLSKNQFDTDQMHLDELTPRYPALLFRLVNPMCWLVFAGIPVTVLFVRRLMVKAPEGRVIFWIFAGMLLLLNVLYLARGEGERSAMYIMPFAVIPAAHLLTQWCRADRSVVPVACALSFMAVQCWLMESLLFTYW